MDFETFSAVSILTAADIVAKTARITLFHLNLAAKLGGKGQGMIGGSLGDAFCRCFLLFFSVAVFGYQKTRGECLKRFFST